MEFNQTNQNTGNVNNTIEPSEGPALMIVPREPLSEIQRARFTIQF